MTDTQVAHQRPAARRGATQEWWFLSNHGFVLLAVARDPHRRIQDYASAVGITDRACQRILNDLGDAGFITKKRIGRRNHYEVNEARNMRHPLVSTQEVSNLLQALVPLGGATRPRTAPPPRF